MKEQIHQAIRENRDRVESLCRQLYQNPETACQEYASAERITAFLREAGFTVETGCAGLETAFRATKKRGNGPRVAIPVEYDALPGIGHACGHHLICGMSLLAGVGLAQILTEYDGEVTLLGTPGEETGEGKPPMVRAGYFDGYDAAMMLHPSNLTCIAPDITSIGVYDITFTGRTAHCGAAPFDGINALDAVVLMYDAVSMMRQQMRDGTRIAGIVLEGGAMTNSIPDRCVIRYEIRTLRMDNYDHVAQRLKRCAEAAALATGCQMEFKLSMPICMPLESSPALTEAYRQILAEYGEEESPQRPDPGATDMGDVSMVLPSLHAFVSVCQGEEKLHTPEFLAVGDLTATYDRMEKWAETMAMLGAKVFQDPVFLAQLREEKLSRPGVPE